MDILNEEFACFKSSVNRMRWFVIALVMISTLILIHVYLEGFSFQDHQLKKVLGDSIVSHTMEKQKCLEEIIKHINEKDDRSNIMVNDIYHKIECCSEDKVGKDYLKELNEQKITDFSAAQSKYSENTFNKLLTENTIRNMHLNI